VAHYGPPRAAMEAVAQALADPSTNQYQPVAVFNEQTAQSPAA